MANVSVCLSVRLSDQCWPALCQTMGHIVTLVGGLVRGIILVFRAPAPLQNSKGNPLSWGIKYTGWENFLIIPFYLENGTR